MDHGLAAVHDDPLAVFFAFLARHGEPGLLDGVAHAGGQRLGLAVGGARSHDHALEQRRELFGIEDLDVLGLDVFEAVNNGALQLGHVALGCGIRFGGSGHQAVINGIGMGSI